MVTYLIIFVLYLLQFPFFVSIGIFMGIEKNINFFILLSIFIIGTIICTFMFYYPLTMILKRYRIYLKLKRWRKKFEKKYGFHGIEIGLLLSTLTLGTPITSLIASSLHVNITRTACLVVAGNITFFVLLFTTMFYLAEMIKTPIVLIVITVLISTLISFVILEITKIVQPKYKRRNGQK